MSEYSEHSFNIHTFSQDEIEKIKPRNRTILISITSPDLPNANINEELYQAVLRLEFHDVEIDHSGDYLTMQPHHARKIKHFVDKYKTGIDHIYIHCLAGLCRSTAIAYVIQRIYHRDKTLPRKWKLYNKHVFNTLMHQYNKRQY